MKPIFVLLKRVIFTYRRMYRCGASSICSLDSVREFQFPMSQAARLRFGLSVQRSAVPFCAALFVGLLNSITHWIVDNFAHVLHIVCRGTHSVTWIRLSGACDAVRLAKKRFTNTESSIHMLETSDAAEKYTNKQTWARASK